jgi:curved DNA-binding protein|tara:strand:+ start:611 stop:1411 length:801 start_codon:yes stop_codon:yes gene_type:complete
MDYYTVLGVSKNASQEELKKAYKKSSMQHHPDRGGDESKFKEINEAYSTLKDPVKKQQYDNPQPQRFEQNYGNFNDIFGSMFGQGFQQQQRRPQNRQVDIAIDLTLEEVFEGKQIAMEIQLPTGRTKLIDINIPAGADHGHTVRYAGMGDNSVPNIAPGDLMVHIRIRNHRDYQRHGDNILCEKKMLVWDLMLGSTVDITTLSGRQLRLNIPAGSQPDTTLSCNGEGIPNIKTGKKGNLLVRIKAIVPTNLTPEQRKKIMEVKHGL